MGRLRTKALKEKQEIVRQLWYERILLLSAFNLTVRSCDDQQRVLNRLILFTVFVVLEYMTWLLCFLGKWQQCKCCACIWIMQINGALHSQCCAIWVWFRNALITINTYSCFSMVLLINSKVVRNNKVYLAEYGISAPFITKKMYGNVCKNVSVYFH